MAITLKDLEEYEASLPDPDGNLEFVDEVLRLNFDLLDDGQPWYIIIGPNSVDVTVPVENDPKMKNVRLVAERLCRFISMQQASFNYLKMVEEQPDHE